MTQKFRFYVPSQPSNINVYIDVIIVGVSIRQGAEMALSHVKLIAPNAEPESYEIMSYED